jgi:hypothetical protein
LEVADHASATFVGELSTRSDDFRRRWGAHNVRTHGAGVKHFHHHIVGDFALTNESLDLRAEPGLTMTVYAAEPNSPTAHALTLLASWAATPDQTGTPAKADHDTSDLNVCPNGGTSIGQGWGPGSGPTADLIHVLPAGVRIAVSMMPGQMALTRTPASPG